MGYGWKSAGAELRSTMFGALIVIVVLAVTSCASEAPRGNITAARCSHWENLKPSEQTDCQVAGYIELSTLEREKLLVDDAVRNAARADLELVLCEPRVPMSKARVRYFDCTLTRGRRGGESYSATATLGPDGVTVTHIDPIQD